MSFQRKHDPFNGRDVYIAVYCVITFVQATMTQWHWNWWGGGAAEVMGLSLYVLCTDILYSSLTLYLQQYLCIFYEVIKMNNIAHNLSAHVVLDLLLVWSHTPTAVCFQNVSSVFYR